MITISFPKLWNIIYFSSYFREERNHVEDFPLIFVHDRIEVVLEEDLEAGFLDFGSQHLQANSKMLFFLRAQIGCLKILNFNNSRNKMKRMIFDGMGR